MLHTIEVLYLFENLKGNGNRYFLENSTDNYY